MKTKINLNEEVLEVDVIKQTASFVLFELEGKQYSVNLNKTDDYKMNLSFDGNDKKVVVARPYFVVDGQDFALSPFKRTRRKSKVHGSGQMTSPMPGKILKVFVKEGDQVEVGAPILIMEAMKMEHTIKANKDGKIEKILFKEGDQVTGGVELVKIC